MNNLEYLDMVVHETVRMHPTVPILWRVCTKEYHTTVRGRPLTIYKDEEIHIPTHTIPLDPHGPPTKNCSTNPAMYNRDCGNERYPHTTHEDAPRCKLAAGSATSAV